MASPSDEDISQFVAFTGQDRSTAVRYLQAANNHVETAISNLFDGVEPGAMSQTYGPEPDPFRIEGGGPSFEIYPADDAGSPGSTKANIGTPPRTRPPTPIAADEQEMGQLDSTGKPYFGPARSGNYDAAQWAMVIPSASSAEVLLDPAAPQRERDDKAQPVLIKPMIPNDPLPALLAILYHIPLAREMLLSRESVLENYGSDSKWWSGTAIELPRIMHVDGQEAQDNSSRDVISETQRLIGFMQDSDRAYGSVEPLTKLNGLTNIEIDSNGWPSLKTHMDRFLYAWTAAILAEGNGDAAELFLTTAINEDGMTETTPFYSMNLSFSRPDELKARSLYAATDDLIWVDDEKGESESREYLGQVAPVLIMRIHNTNESDLGLDVTVPLTWYLDRYLEPFADKGKEMRQRLAAHQAKLKQIDERKKTLQKFKRPRDEEEMESSTLVSTAINFLNPNVRKMKEAAARQPPTKPELEEVEPHCEQLAEQLAQLYARVEQKLKELDAEREVMEKKLVEFSALFDEPLPGSEKEPTHRYNLRGVAAINENITYILRDDLTGEGAQWWKLSYTEVPWVHRERTTEEAVLKAANHDSRDVLLVYASDDASTPTAQLPLPEPLATFVKVDNRLFKEERDEAIAEAEAGATANVNAMDTSWGDEYSEVELPPAYDDDNDAQWDPEGNAHANDAWMPDPGPNVLSDAEYQYNSNAQFTPANASENNSKYLDPLMESIGHPTPARTAGAASVAQTVSATNPTRHATASLTNPTVTEYGVPRKGVGTVSGGSTGGHQRQGQGKGGADYVEDVDMA